MNTNLGNACRMAQISDWNSDPVYRQLVPKLKRFAALLKEHGIEIGIESAKARIAWESLPTSRRLAALEGFSQYLSNCEDLTKAGISLRDNYALLDHSMKRLNLSAKDDIKSFVTNQNIVEIYNLDHIQLYRSINFFDLCNYSLLDLLAREWFDLYERLSSVTEYTISEFLQVIKSGKLTRLTVPLHLLKEKDSDPRGIFNFDLQYCCPLYCSSGLVSGYLLTENVTELDLYAAGDESFRFLR
jgi:hypothetical protein